jgi:hypothetical protein
MWGAGRRRRLLLLLLLLLLPWLVGVVGSGVTVHTVVVVVV